MIRNQTVTANPDGLTPRSQNCNVPGCRKPRESEDCCDEHSQNQAGASRRVPNDGIIDWTAVETAVSGARSVKLTWVEASIAGGMMLADECTITQIRNQTGLQLKTRDSVDAIQRIAEAIRDGR